MAGHSEQDWKNGQIRAVGAGLGLTLTALIFSAIFGSLITILMFLAGLTIENTVVVVALLIAGQLGFFVTGYLYIRRYGLSVSIAPLDGRDLKYTGAGIVGALTFATCAGLVLTWTGLTPEAVLEEIVPQNPVIAIWLIVLSIFVIAPAEEFLFRGVIQNRLRKTFSAPTAIFIASILFGSLHFGNYMGSLSAVIGWLLLIVGVGAIMGVLYERTNNLTVPIITHAAYNVVQFIFGYLTL